MKKKVALIFVCVNQPYWPFFYQVVADAKKHFLTNHDVDILAWTDIPEDLNPGATFFPTEPIGWPYPTLMRYHLFLQQEEVLKGYDYIFYLDADMRIVDTVGDEIMGEGLTMAEHPMYSLRREYIPPYEPNPASQAYIPRLGVVIQNEQGGPWFKPLYAAGGLQGGRADLFIEAMKKMRDGIDKDFNNNYTAIWNDESHWNKYLYDYRGHITVLSPSYVYPDSLIENYYVKIWGKNYKPIIVTLTKKFTTTVQGGDELKAKLASM
jgi:histo-blood group ABO system transferase